MKVDSKRNFNIKKIRWNGNEIQYPSLSLSLYIYIYNLSEIKCNSTHIQQHYLYTYNQILITTLLENKKNLNQTSYVYKKKYMKEKRNITLSVLFFRIFTPLQLTIQWILKCINEIFFFRMFICFIYILINIFNFSLTTFIIQLLVNTILFIWLLWCDVMTMMSLQSRFFYRNTYLIFPFFPMPNWYILNIIKPIRISVFLLE